MPADGVFADIVEVTVLLGVYGCRRHVTAGVRTLGFTFFPPSLPGSLSLGVEVVIDILSGAKVPHSHLLFAF